MEIKNEKEFINLIGILKQENLPFLKVCHIVVNYLKEALELALKNESTEVNEEVYFQNFEDEDIPFTETEEVEFDETNPLNKEELRYFEEFQSELVFNNDEDVPQEQEDEF